jgi:hypothetical protein
LEGKTIAIKLTSGSNETSLQLITIIVAVVSAFIAAITFHYTRRYARNTFHFTALVKAFELLNHNAHRNARIRLYRVAGVKDISLRRGTPRGIRC